ncbi:hypothetical protein FRB90_009669, partial [Tulasnella sp. 427]
RTHIHPMLFNRHHSRCTRLVLRSSGCRCRARVPPCWPSRLPSLLNQLSPFNTSPPTAPGMVKLQTLGLSNFTRTLQPTNFS